MNFEYKEYGNLGEIRIGLKRDELLEKLGDQNLESFKRTEDEKSNSDYFKEYGLFIYYDENYVSEGFEFNDTSIVLYNGKNLLDLRIRDVLEIISKDDQNLIKDFSGFTSTKLGISAYTGLGIDELDEKFESIMFFRKGYYDDVEI